jgi:hypothetical protein
VSPRWTISGDDGAGGETNDDVEVISERIDEVSQLITETAGGECSSTASARTVVAEPKALPPERLRVVSPVGVDGRYLGSSNETEEAVAVKKNEDITPHRKIFYTKKVENRFENRCRRQKKSVNARCVRRATLT